MPCDGCGFANRAEMSLHQSTIIHVRMQTLPMNRESDFIVRFITSDIKNRERAMMRVRGMLIAAIWFWPNLHRDGPTQRFCCLASLQQPEELILKIS